MASPFHPVTARWFENSFREPTPAQARGWSAIRERRHTLIAAPTGSGKTLAAFLTALDDLVREADAAPLPDEVRVLYVSPLKALSADIHKNLAEPRRGIRGVAEAMGLTPPRITAAVRTGDTTASERAAMLRRPPHILVTTPESLYLLLTAEKSRAMLRTVRTVIVDEIHAVIGTRRGAHLALSLERLQALAAQPFVRIGLSATQKPIGAVARFLVGREDACAIVDEGHRRALDVGLEVPNSPLEALMSHEVWAEYYERLATLIRAHQTTLVFVNTRRMAERVARHLADRLGEDAVTAHHGSLSKEKRLDAEMRLKSGRLRALVATASLELGIDIGSIDLVCQIGSPHRIATALQRIGRAGHQVSGTPKGRLFPESRDDLVECAALLRAIRRGELDAIVEYDAPLDVLAQQVVAEAAARDCTEDELFDLVRGAWPYRALARSAFDAVVAMASDGIATKRGRRGALLHRDEVQRRLRGRRGTRLLALSSGGAIPDVADYRVVLDPDDTFIGTVNEDFAIESLAGDIFQLGNLSWRILQVGSGTVRVADAKGAPPTIPFWLGEAPARSDELSKAVSDLRADVACMLERDRSSFDKLRMSGTAAIPARPEPVDGTSAGPELVEVRAVIDWFTAETGVPIAAAEQAIAYLADAWRALGVLPTQDQLVLERFFDESGGMQLVLHAPFGSRINKAWGLALRKRFCRQFNFELQAAATEDALLLSLGPQHSFPLSDVFRYLHPATARDVLVQAFLDAPVFQTRWRWNTSIALAVPRNRRGKKVPAQLQRMLADDLMAAVFPDAAACLENIPGDRQIPDHPLVAQTVRDCLEEAMDFPALAAILDRVHRGEIRCVARDTPEPSPLAHEILTARPYAFLDDAPAEERRTLAVQARRATDPASASDVGALDAAAIARVRDEQRPDPRDADELHDALMTVGVLTRDEAPDDLVRQLAAAGRAAMFTARRHGAADLADAERVDGRAIVAAERIPELRAVHADLVLDPPIDAPATRLARGWTRDEALVELVRGRLTIAGPTTADAVATTLGVPAAEVDAALLTLESEGFAMRGRFTAIPRSHPAPLLEWCDRTLLARIHRYTLNRLRAEIEPVSPADFMRYLFAWQHVDPAHRLAGLDGLRAVVEQLDSYDIAADAWEKSVLPARVDGYEPALLDTLCLTGEVGWARRPSGEAVEMTGAMPIALFMRHGDEAAGGRSGDEVAPPFAAAAEKVLAALRERGPSFAHEIARACEMTEDEVRGALADLVSAGAATADGFGGLRWLLRSDTRRPTRTQMAGRWSALASAAPLVSGTCQASAWHVPDTNGGARGGASGRAGANRRTDTTTDVDAWALRLLARYGIVCRRLLARETRIPRWRDLVTVYRRLEARGEIRGGRFVSGLSGEQFARPDAIERLREIRRTPADGRLVTLTGVDPLNLAGLVTAGERVRAAAGTRLVYRDGVPVAALEGDYLRPLSDLVPADAARIASALTGRAMPPVTSGFVGR
ncbi:MAG TPA: DEAD/DEAH box helicase [Vicinamibacterales bacterium]|nr:DEAD/DEAH box helicase [Vicinamibacterales bacterium]